MPYGANWVFCPNCGKKVNNVAEIEKNHSPIVENVVQKK